jgi:KDO2-lipid IV(A) lauroyltransferase
VHYWVYRLAQMVSTALPRQQAYAAGRALADAFYLLDARGRAAVTSNLRRTCRHAEAERSDGGTGSLVRSTFRHFGMYLVDFFRCSQLSAAEFAESVRVERAEYLTECMERGRGTIVVTGHVGNWELGGAMLSHLGHRVHAVALPERLVKLNRLFERQRSQRGIHVVPLGHAASALTRALNRGELVALLADRDFTGHANWVPFFGERAPFPRGPALLALRTRTPILPAFLVRTAPDSYLFRFYPPIEPEAAWEALSIQRRICGVLEDIIGEFPCQWFVFEDFWHDGRIHEPGRGGVRRESRAGPGGRARAIAFGAT